MSRKILITGADGFIGSHLAEALVHAGHQVRALVLYNAFGSHGWLDHADDRARSGMEIVPGDVRDAQSVRDATRGCDVVMHLAALIAIPYSYQSPDSYVETNIRGTLNVLQAAREFAVGQVIHTSTSEVYGSARRVPISEDHPLHAQSPYAATKIGADQLALSFHASFGTPVTILRPFNTYGPRQSVRAVIPSIIMQIAGGLTELKLGALHPTRDFSFVADTVRAFERTLNATAVHGEVLNIGSNFEISIGDTAHLIAEIMGATIRIATDRQRLRPAASEVERLWAATDKAQRLLDWQPDHAGHAGFRRGLEQTIAWFRDSSHIARYPVGSYSL